MAKTDLRKKAMTDLGITTYKEAKKQRKLRPIPTPAIIPKTPLMKYIELVEGEPIESILLSGSLSVVANRLNTDPSTISKWIKRFKLRYTADNLPTCKDCHSYGPACDSGVCYILIEAELYDLLPMKKEEMLDE